MAEETPEAARPAAARLESGKWLDRKEGLNACRDGADVTGPQLAKLLLGEANASVVDACATAASNRGRGLEAIEAWALRSPADDVRAAAAGLAPPLVSKGVASSRPSTSKKARGALDAVWASSGDSKDVVFGSLLEGVAVKGKGAAACAGALAALVLRDGGWDASSSPVAAADVANAVVAMFAAAAPETRTAAASLVVSLGGDLAAAIEDRLDHPQKKLVDMARNVAQNPVATAAPQRKPAPGAVAVEPVEAQPGDDAVTERPLTGAVAMERPLDRSLTGTATGTYGDENKENARDEPAAAKKPSASGGRALAGVLAVLAEKGVAAPFAVFSATSKWAERMEAVDLVASLLTGASALSEASRDDVDGFVALFEQFVALARDESHVKVVQNVVAALGVLVEYDQGHPAVGAARRGAFAALVPRLKDKRLSVSVSAVCAAIARNDSKLVTDETVLQVLTTSLSVADKAKRLPPSGRAALLAWMAQALPQKLALASCQALAALAAPDASDAVADVRGAACAALAALVLRAAPAQLKAVEALDKRSLKKIAEIHDVAAPSLAAPSQKATDAPKRETAKPSAKADEKAKTGRPSTSGGATTGRPSTSGGASAAKAGGASATAKALAPRPASARPGTQRPQTARSSLEESGSSMAPADLAGVPVSARANAVAEVVTPAVRKGLLEGSDKESWKKRKTALESVLWACRAVSHDSDKFVADGQATRALLGELRARLADSNAKLRPLACDALHALLCAVAPKVAQLKLGKLALKAALGAVTDMSRGVRDRALELLGCVVGEGQGDETNLKAFGDAMALIGATLANPSAPLAKPALLAWVEARAARARADDAEAHLVKPLLALMRDKALPTRDAATSCLCALVHRRAVSRRSVDLVMRDISPAAKLALEGTIVAMFDEAPVDEPIDDDASQPTGPEDAAPHGAEDDDASAAPRDDPTSSAAAAPEALPNATALDDDDVRRRAAADAAARAVDFGDARSDGALSDGDVPAVDVPPVFDFHVGSAPRFADGAAPLAAADDAGVGRTLERFATQLAGPASPNTKPGAASDDVILALRRCAASGPAPGRVRTLARLVSAAVAKLEHADADAAAATDVALAAIRALRAALSETTPYEAVCDVLRVSTRCAVEPWLDLEGVSAEGVSVEDGAVEDGAVSAADEALEKRHRVRCALDDAAAAVRASPHALGAALALLRESALRGGADAAAELLVQSQLATIVAEAKPTVHALRPAHDLLVAVPANAPHLALDCARTARCRVLLRLIDTVGLAKLLAAADASSISRNSPLVQLASMIGGDSPVADGDGKVEARPLSKSPIKSPKLSTAERLEAAKAAYGQLGRGGAAAAPAAASKDATTIADRISQLRQRLADARST